MRAENNVNSSEAYREWKEREQRQACWVNAPGEKVIWSKPEIMDHADMCTVLWFNQELSLFLGSINCPNSTCIDSHMSSGSDQLLAKSTASRNSFHLNFSSFRTCVTLPSSNMNIKWGGLYFFQPDTFDRWRDSKIIQNNGSLFDILSICCPLVV